MLRKLALLFHTLRHLKPIQFYWRFYLKINKFIPFSVAVKETIKVRHLDLTAQLVKHNVLSDNQFLFLNETSSSELPIDWNSSQMSKLWLYNLHYFDYLNQEQIDKSIALDLIHDWINENQISTGNGWEPYPLSLRIVNWIKFLSFNNLSDVKLTQIDESLFLQTRFLFRHLEYHLLGNHLFKNGVALIFSGIYFEGVEAKRWLKKGRQIITQQTREQVLKDGGHFERSPLYHVLILEDILDCFNLNLSVHYFSPSEADFIKLQTANMLAFLEYIVHQDGEIPFFNDSALMIASKPEAILQYANSLGVEPTKQDMALKDLTSVSIAEKPDFGLYIIQNQKSRMIFDAGPIGPDYLPGHTHCDTLSYELSIAGYRCIVNSGTYQYAGTFRNHFRSTSAHNTVKIDNAEQHEIWSTFRVARRGYPFDIFVKKLSFDSVECSASHSGYKRLPGKPIHNRLVNYQEDQVIIEDLIEGNGNHLAESFIHLHPDVKIISSTSNLLKCKRGDISFAIQTDQSEFEIEKGWFSPKFGEKIETSVVVLRKHGATPYSFGYTISF